MKNKIIVKKLPQERFEQLLNVQIGKNERRVKRERKLQDKRNRVQDLGYNPYQE